MNGLRRALYRQWGALSPHVEQLASEDFSSIVNDLLSAAVERWHAYEWARYDSKEVNCSIRLYASLEEVRREHPGRYWWVRVSLEWASPTLGMLAGTEDASRMGRPDLRVHIGGVGRTVECKRLSPALARAYVKDGLARFVTGRYSADEAEGMMVGFVQQGDPDAIVGAINTHVSSHPLMGRSAMLTSMEGATEVRRAYLSQHERKDLASIRVLHHHLLLTETA